MFDWVIYIWASANFQSEAKVEQVIAIVVIVVIVVFNDFYSSVNFV